MKPQREVLEIAKKAARRLNSGHLKDEPAWFKAVLANPPATDFTKRVRDGSLVDETGERMSVRELLRPQEIKYPEDAVRKLFYEQHPWELARPRSLVEGDGLDYKRADWSRFEQPHKPVDGESVVQRTLWIMTNHKVPQQEAYRLALAEFYKVRVRQTVEDQTVVEEARMFGAAFAKSSFDWGLDLEAKALEEWKTNAAALSKRRAARFDMAEEVLDEAEAEPEVGAGV